MLVSKANGWPKRDSLSRTPIFYFLFLFNFIFCPIDLALRYWFFSFFLRLVLIQRISWLEAICSPISYYPPLYSLVLYTIKKCIIIYKQIRWHVIAPSFPLLVKANQRAFLQENWGGVPSYNQCRFGSLKLRRNSSSNQMEFWHLSINSFICCEDVFLLNLHVVYLEHIKISPILRSQTILQHKSHKKDRIHVIFFPWRLAILPIILPDS